MGFSDLIVVESDLKLQFAEDTIKILGVQSILEKHKVPFKNLSNLPRDENEIPFLIQKTQLINVPVFHTHTFAKLSCASKNLFGLLPVYREKYHNKLSEKLLELVHYVKPCLTLVDGTVGLDGGSMRMGNPRRLDLVSAGWNPLAVDYLAAKIMGFSIDSIPLLKIADSRGFLKKIRIKGDYTFDSLPNYNFEYKTSNIAKIDLWLRRTSLTKSFFHYNSLLDRIAQHSRKLVTSINYSNKHNRILNGSWMEYQKNINPLLEDLS